MVGKLRFPRSVWSTLRCKDILYRRRAGPSLGSGTRYLLLARAIAARGTVRVSGRQLDNLGAILVIDRHGRPPAVMVHDIDISAASSCGGGRSMLRFTVVIAASGGKP